MAAALMAARAAGSVEASVAALPDDERADAERLSRRAGDAVGDLGHEIVGVCAVGRAARRGR
jgi:hypothetical protein